MEHEQYFKFMKHTHPAVFAAIQSLLEKNPDGKMTFAQIAIEADVGIASVERAIPALLQTKLIARSGNGKRGSYRYKVLKDAYPKRISSTSRTQ